MIIITECQTQIYNLKGQHEINHIVASANRYSSYSRGERKPSGSPNVCGRKNCLWFWELHCRKICSNNVRQNKITARRDVLLDVVKFRMCWFLRRTTMCSFSMCAARGQTAACCGKHSARFESLQRAFTLKGCVFPAGKCCFLFCYLFELTFGLLLPVMSLHWAPQLLLPAKAYLWLS